MIKQLLVKRVKYWLKKYKNSKNQLTKHSIELVLNELLQISEYLHNNHLISIRSYLDIRDLINSKKENNG